MIKYFQILWDTLMLRDAALKGQLKWRDWVIAIGFVLLLYAIGLPAAIFWANHPQDELVFVTAMVLDGILAVAFIVWAWKWRAKEAAARAGGAAAANSASGDSAGSQRQPGGD